jgi:hypothetical protein
MLLHVQKKLFFVCEKKGFFLFFITWAFLACKWNNRPCKLYLHYEHGFTLYTNPDNGHGNVRLLWQESFEKLRSSSDDNNHLLMLDFHGEEGAVVRRDLTFND